VFEDLGAHHRIELPIPEREMLAFSRHDHAGADLPGGRHGGVRDVDTHDIEAGGRQLATDETSATTDIEHPASGGEHTLERGTEVGNPERIQECVEAEQQPLRIPPVVSIKV
jgi:hypothetical protein